MDRFWSVTAPRKNPSEHPIFIGLFLAHTTRFFISQTKTNRTYLTICFIVVLFGTYGQICYQSSEVSLLDCVTPIFCYRTVVGAHNPIFLSLTNCRMERTDFCRTKSWRTRSDFYSDFFVYDRKSVCVR